MRTVPKPELSQPKSGDLTWNVMRSRFPFQMPNERLGIVHAPDKKTAQQKAEDHYGRDVVVERELLRNVEPNRSAN